MRHAETDGGETWSFSRCRPSRGGGSPLGDRARVGTVLVSRWVLPSEIPSLVDSCACQACSAVGAAGILSRVIRAAEILPRSACVRHSPGVCTAMLGHFGGGESSPLLIFRRAKFFHFRRVSVRGTHRHEANEDQICTSRDRVSFRDSVRSPLVAATLVIHPGGR